jgi:hypothetical protein
VKMSGTSRFLLPLPGWVLHPFTAVIIAGVHVYLSLGHLSVLFQGTPQWTDLWKGFGAMFGAYVFAALATRGVARNKSQLPSAEPLRQRQGGVL